MTKDDIIRMARDSGLKFQEHLDEFVSPFSDGVYFEDLEDFAALVAAAEREECAIVAFNAKTYLEAAAAIRARGQG